VPAGAHFQGQVDGVGARRCQTPQFSITRGRGSVCVPEHATTGLRAVRRQTLISPQPDLRSFRTYRRYTRWIGSTSLILESAKPESDGKADKIGDRRADYIVAWRDKLSFNHSEHGHDQ